MFHVLCPSKDEQFSNENKNTNIHGFNYLIKMKALLLLGTYRRTPLQKTSKEIILWAIDITYLNLQLSKIN